MLGTKEHYDLIEQFDRQFKGQRLDKEEKALWRKGHVYQDGHTDALYHAFFRGYALGKAVERPPSLAVGAEVPGEGRDALAAFGAWAAKEFRDSLADVDGGSAQDAMERCGVIVKRTVTEPCGEGCICVEYGDFPHECFVFPAEVSAAIAAMAAPQEKQP